jgi:hypothetical protein
LPAIPQWFLRLPDIVEQLRQLKAPVVDRAGIEKVFGVGRRRALQLLHRFGGFQSAQSFLVERQGLIRRLESIVTGEAFVFEQARRRRVEEMLETARRQRAAAAVRIPASRESRAASEFTAPAGVRLTPGRLEVDFSRAEDLLGKLYALSQAVANDFEGFRDCVETVPSNTCR